jgi:hypothetical protein
MRRPPRRSRMRRIILQAHFSRKVVPSGQRASFGENELWGIVTNMPLLYYFSNLTPKDSLTIAKYFV